MFQTLIEKDWLECPECESNDLLTYTEPMELTDVIACRECGYSDTAMVAEELHR